jgi:hypothetical protein
MEASASARVTRPTRVPLSDGGYRIDYPDGHSEVHSPDGKVTIVTQQDRDIADALSGQD